MSILESNYLSTDSLSNGSNLGNVIQTVVLDNSTIYSQSTGANVYTEVSGLSGVQITPRRSFNRILIYVKWCGEIASMWDVTWTMGRNGSLINLPSGYSNRNAGATCAADTYSSSAVNNASTPAQMNFWTLDTPSTTSTINYSLYIRSRTNQTLYTNRTQSDTNNNSYERMISSIHLLEVSGPGS